ncbi:uncharacterized protein LOC117216075 [Bombus bifarius]|uniref:Uncharacterized protein LOC117213396 n=2 Tax=Bombus bifarius TaxID=103933 RepID=A0A6P8N1R7_9HYME|nr:uncharacterized protein LOC117213396 [Bombus bifarius]XP_033314640.1 uncharacterized protein LOC117213401 [Bombus bifarius]XP_033314644.1 uncharacterized protein LOC117213404 [Bombus bifarius]XP_033317558.1 uncharacterized protein LOC117215292 [Bombus bifarius]XP_033318488.1 uncharacterized protein LOC117216075 [Bombus bifarius]
MTEHIRPIASELLSNDLVITAQINILNDKQQPIRRRALLDTGSSMNFITEELAKSLKIRQNKCSVPIGALDTLTTTSKRHITTTITSTDGTYTRTLTFLVIPTISTFIPSEPIDRSTLEIPKSLKLADPRFHLPAPIDVLLSSGSTLASMCVGQVNLTQPDEPGLRLQKTRFGWRQIDDTKNTSKPTPDAPAKDDTSSLYLSTISFSHSDPLKRWREYLALGHMTKVNDNHSDDNGYYLPHHGVTKASSQTTKLRVVFDGSAPSTTGTSLNDTLHTGPKLQEDLFSPYLAIRCLKQLAEDEGHRFPRAAQVLQRDFYVDDALTGAETKDEALTLRTELTNLLQLAGLNIRKWASNDNDLLHGLSLEETNHQHFLGDSQTLKTLGVFWNSSDDSILYSVEVKPTPSRVTKRIISSEIAKIYDPLGLLAPVIVRAKMLLQRIWSSKIDWDESLPIELHIEWERYYAQLPLLNNVRFPRKAIIESAIEIELHGFCDASEKAYGACVYLRTLNTNGRVWTQLLTAKSKVAPLKCQTIPRLELSGALLLTSLMSTVQQALSHKITRTIYWTDSTIVLHWLNTSPHTLKTFVANRVSEIQTKTSIRDWRHVPTDDNPADLISRGQTPEEFLRPTIWQHGPAWLYQSEGYWPTWDLTPQIELPEQKGAICLSANPSDYSLLQRYSSWPKLIRIIARCLRWKQKKNRAAPLTVTELRITHNKLIKLLQNIHLSEEIRTLQKDRNAAIKGKLTRLNPFIDKEGILRVGGRLSHSSMTFAQKHPIVLPKSSVTTRIIEHEHKIHMHSGTQATLYAVRQRYWPVDGRSQVWRAIKGCVRCCRAQPPPVEYVMGNLPEARVTESRPFTNVGVDYCGPFHIKEKRDRNRRQIKVYVAIFVCLAIKAVHIELVDDLTSEAFIAALRRFIARRGYCSTIHSDNGTNFRGASNELRELHDLLQSDDHKEKVTAFLADKQIEWRFIPPHSPHFGGLWEAAK